MIIRPATAEDLTAVGGRRETCRAMVAEESGQTLCVFGVYPQSTRWILFAWAKDEFRANRRGVIKAVRAMWELIGSRPAMPLMAHADPSIKGSDVLLKHMGFEHWNAGIYQCPGNKPYLPRCQ